MSDASPVSHLYGRLVDAGTVEDDPAQRAVLTELDRLAAELSRGARPNGFGWFRKKSQAAERPRGVYLHGDVGRGKTMLMDLFFEAMGGKRARRIHFNGFMSDVHERIHALREAERSGKRDKGDPIAPVAGDIASEVGLLCLDEFQVTDIADAMILSRLFEALFAHGVVLVATSNSAPGDLYRHGLNRPLFLPFVEVLKAHVRVVNLDAEKDYRLAMLSGQPIYLVPPDAAAKAALDALWTEITHGAAVESQTIRFKGRSLEAKRTAGAAARFGFAELCDAPLGAADFLAIATRFDTVMVEDIPVIAPGRREMARRFILMIDAFYDLKVKLIVSAEAEPEELYVAGDSVAEAFQRTASRLIEMRSAAYLGESHRAVTPEAARNIESLAPVEQSG